MQQATPAARILSMFPARQRGSIVTPQRNSLAENMPGEGQGKASASELSYGGSLLLWQPHFSTAEAACRARRQSARASGVREVLADGFCRLGSKAR